MSDRIQLSNFAGDMNEWQVYMRIGNSSANIHKMPSTLSIVMVILLQVPIKNHNICQKQLDEQRQTNQGAE
jgi:hypothetical protein